MAAQSPVQRDDNGKKGSFYYAEDGQRLAEMTYVWAGSDTLIVDHTTVDDRLKGQGIGARLAEALVDFARSEHKKVIALCPFAKAFFDKNPQYNDILK